MTTFDDWLRQLAAAGKGPVTLYTCTRGRAFTFSFPLLGNWTGATFRGQVRLYPDAPGAALATFDCEAPVLLGEWSIFTFGLAAGSGADSTGILPAAEAGDGFAQFAYDLLLTPAGGTEDLLFGGILPAIGRITA